ncbi:DUF4394 domain-containing protein [Limnoglobus roseus]|uniref:Calx-beta domain-containing protein n=1 Tax=Limnoglobus roseus TaxID=2598579 RepID=A0A5C1A6U1_9BACT|nr:DUF4394 domain-containing protein [Limnoglobus roseus]QEL14969.1 hypothetical protein PX52LOC_01872 [Limnoglobus roseus]
MLRRNSKSGRHTKAERKLVRPIVSFETLEGREVPAVAFALSGSNLLAFDTASPATTATTAITGVAAGETLAGIDFRPQNGHLYALGVNAGADTMSLYDISTRTGVATVVGAGGFTGGGNLPDPATTQFGIDFNPAVDRLRVTTVEGGVAGSQGLNFRVNPNTGTLAGADTDINPVGTTVDEVAYTNNSPNNGNVTTLYTLDSATDSLFIQNPANSGTQTLGQTVTLGGSKLDFSNAAGFDIPIGVNAPSSNMAVTTGSAFAVLTVGGTTALYSINLVNAQATLIGNVGTGATAIDGFAIQNDSGGFPAIALNDTGTSLLRFNTATPGTVTPQVLDLTAVTAGETLVGIDFRPQTGQLYGLGINATTDKGSLYLIDPQTGVVSLAVTGKASAITFAGADFPDPAVAGYGFDFNPTVDRIRVTTSTGLNFRVNPITGAPAAATLDGPISGLPAGSTGVSSAAYTNSFGQSLTGGVTTLYTLDAASDSLYIQNPANGGTQTAPLPITLGGAPLDFSDVTGFDIPAGVRVATSNDPQTAAQGGRGFAALTVGGLTNLYSINLATGVATLVGPIDTGAVQAAGFTLADAPAGTVNFSSPTLFVTENGGTLTVTATRTGGTNGTVNVTVNATGGTAVAGTDFSGTPLTLTFADGSATATGTITINDNAVLGGNKSITLALASPTNGAVLGAATTATATIIEDEGAPTIGAGTVYALSNNSLIAFDPLNPTAANAPIAVTNLAATDTLQGIDFRPQNGLLYGLGYNGTAGTVQLYLISVQTGVATPVGTSGAFVDSLGNPVRIGVDDTTTFGFDFNPTVDRIRVVTSSGQTFRMNPNNGAFVDGDLGGAAMSVNGLNMDGSIKGGATGVDGAAYTNNAPSVTVTTLYTLDATTDSLFIQSPPNTGTQGSAKVITFNGLPLDFTAARGFDIQPGVNAVASNAPVAGSALAVLTVAGSDILYSIDLTNGVATFFGPIGDGTALIDGLAIQGSAVAGGLPAIGLNAAGTGLIRFNTATPATISPTVNVTGVTAGETLVGIDFRPATGQLYGLGVNATTDKGSLYLVDPQTGVATVVGTAGSVTFVDVDGVTPVDLPDPATTGYGFDFNPTVDRIRVTTDSGLNFRINPITGAPVDGDGTGLTTTPANGTNTDGPANGLPGGSTGVSGVAYTNNFGGASKTTLYTLDADSDSLFIQNPANAGTQTTQIAITVGGATLDFTNVNGFDIPGNVSVTASSAVAAGVGYAALTVGTATHLYSIDLATGEATDLGLVGLGGTGLAGLALGNGPTGTISFDSLTFSQSEAGPTADLTLTRSNGTGTVSVTVMFTDGTATGGTDFIATPITVTFAEGQTTATVSVPLTDDAIFEGDETFTATLTSPTNGAVLGAISSTEVTITDDETQPTVSIANATVTEGNAGTTALTFTVTLSGASATPVTVMIDTADGTATAGSDYTALVGQTITFAPGETSKTVTVNVTGDTTFESNETFTATLSAPVGATLAADTATGTITNDDTAPVVSINNVTQAEGNTGTTAFNFTVTLSNASDQPIVLTVNTVDGTATAGSDYTALVGQTITFAPGETSKTVTVNVAGDTTFEVDETFNVRLSVAGPGGAVTVANGVGTITNDDAAPTVSINGTAQNEGNTGTTPFTFTITLSAPSGQAVTVVVATANNTATAGSDYTALAAQTITFAPGETTKTVTVDVTGDTTVEADETFFVTLSAPTGATLGASAKGVGTIVNDDTGTTPSKTLLVGSPVTAIGAGSGTPTVRVIAADGTQISSSAAFASTFTGGVRTAVADVNGDGVPDVIVGTGPGTSSLVRVLDGSTGKELFSVAPFEASFTGGVFVAVGDVNGDGVPDVVISPDQGGGPRVDIYNGKSFTKIDSFFGIDDPAFRGGARVAIGDINGDGVGDLAVAAGFQGGPRVAAFNGKSLGTATRVKLFNDFFAFEQTLRNGVFIAIGDVDGDGFGDIIAGGGPGGGPRVTVFNAATLISSQGGTLTPLANFFAGDVNNRLGVQVAVKDVDGDNRADIRTVVGGSDQVVTYLGKDLTPTGQPTGTTTDGLPDFNGGVFIG